MIVSKRKRRKGKEKEVGEEIWAKGDIWAKAVVLAEGREQTTRFDTKHRRRPKDPSASWEHIISINSPSLTTKINAGPRRKPTRGPKLGP